MSFLNNIKVGIVDFINRIEFLVTNKTSPIISLPSELIVRLFSSLKNSKDLGSLERSCKSFWEIASHPDRAIHTPLRLASRELIMKLDREMEGVAMTTLARPLSDIESYSASFFFSEDHPSYSRLTGICDTAFERLSEIFIQKIDLANITDEKVKLFVEAGGKAIERMTEVAIRPREKDRDIVTKIVAAQQRFSSSFHKNMRISYAQQPVEAITPKSYTEKVAQLCRFANLHHFIILTENLVTSQLTSELCIVHGREFGIEFEEKLRDYQEAAVSNKKSSSIGYPLLIDLGIANDEDYSKQLHCRPDDPQKRGIQSREDLEIICPTFTLNVESIQLAEDVQQDRLEAQKTAGQRKQKLSDVVESMSGALKKMTTEAKTSGVILYESGCPWSDLEEELNAFQNEFKEIVKRCEGPKELIEAFNADNFNLLTNRLNALAKKFNEGFPGLYRAHQIRKLEYYMNQFGILRAWKNRADQGLPQNLASLPASERTLQRLFSMGQ